MSKSRLDKVGVPDHYRVTAKVNNDPNTVYAFEEKTEKLVNETITRLKKDTSNKWKSIKVYACLDCTKKFIP